MKIVDRVADYSAEEVYRHMYKACQVDRFRYWPASHRNQLRELFLAERPNGSLADMTHWLIGRSVDASTYV